MTGPQRKTPPNLYILKLTFLFFVTGMLMLIGAMAAAIVVLPGLAELQSLRNPHGWLLAHAMLLGWASMVAMGASLQLTQVIMRTTIFSRTLGFVQYGCFIAGLVALMLGFLGEPAWIAVGGSAVTIGVILYVINLAVTHIRKKEWSVFVLGAALSQLAYLMTVGLGVAMGVYFATGWSFAAHEALFYSHMWFGVAGWLSGLIVIYSYKLLPMFYVSKKKPDRSAYAVIGGFQAGVWIHTVARWTDLEWLGYLGSMCLIASLAWFTISMFTIRKQRNGKQSAGVVNIAFALIPFTFLAFIVWSLWSVWSVGVFQQAFLLYLIAGWFTATILSYLSKIIPFLWWAHRYRTKEEKKGAVLLSDMLPEKRLTVELTIYVLAILGVAVGFAFGLPTLVFMAQSAAFLALVIYLFELARVFRY
jgi:hypothetical protein